MRREGHGHQPWRWIRIRTLAWAGAAMPPTPHAQERTNRKPQRRQRCKRATPLVEGAK